MTSKELASLAFSSAALRKFSNHAGRLCQRACCGLPEDFRGGLLRGSGMSNSACRAHGNFFPFYRNDGHHALFSPGKGPVGVSRFGVGQLLEDRS